MERKNSRIRFGTRVLFLLTVVCGLLSAGIGACMRMQREAELSRYLRDPNRWPQPFQALIEKNLVLQEQVQAYAISQLFDHRTVVSLVNGEQAVESLINEFRLVPTDSKHPLAKELFRLIPNAWDKPEFANCKWYTTTGFGFAHMEGQDLFLIATDSNSGITVILYDWIF